jgi:hypothetical protein
MQTPLPQETDTQSLGLLGSVTDGDLNVIDGLVIFAYCTFLGISLSRDHGCSDSCSDSGVAELQEPLLFLQVAMDLNGYDFTRSFTRENEAEREG